MASYNELNALIDAYINRNGVQAITGQILNGVLKAMVEQLGRGYNIMGAATPTTDPGTPDGPECYFASETGTYTDFDGLQVVPGELALLCYTPSDGWTKATIYEGFRQVGATIDGNVGTPSVGVSYADGVLSFDFHNMKGNPGQNGQDGQDGAAAGFGTIGADITGGIGTPGVTVESSGPATAKNLQFHFTNLKGETGVTSVVATVDNTTGTPACTVSLVGQQLTLAFSGLKGAQGDTGSSVDYPFTIVNNLTTDDATQALSAAQGVVLDGKVTQLEAKVDSGIINPLGDPVNVTLPPANIVANLYCSTNDSAFSTNIYYSIYYVRMTANVKVTYKTANKTLGTGVAISVSDSIPANGVPYTKIVKQDPEVEGTFYANNGQYICLLIPNGNDSYLPTVLYTQDVMSVDIPETLNELEDSISEFTKMREFNLLPTYFLGKRMIDTMTRTRWYNSTNTKIGNFTPVSATESTVTLSADDAACIPRVVILACKMSDGSYRYAYFSAASSNIITKLCDFGQNIDCQNIVSIESIHDTIDGAQGQHLSPYGYRAMAWDIYTKLGKKEQFGDIFVGGWAAQYCQGSTHYTDPLVRDSAGNLVCSPVLTGISVGGAFNRCEMIWAQSLSAQKINANTYYYVAQSSPNGATIQFDLPSKYKFKGFLRILAGTGIDSPGAVNMTVKDLSGTTIATKTISSCLDSYIIDLDAKYYDGVSVIFTMPNATNTELKILEMTLHETYAVSAQFRKIDSSSVVALLGSSNTQFPSLATAESLCPGDPDNAIVVRPDGTEGDGCGYLGKELARISGATVDNWGKSGQQTSYGLSMLDKIFETKAYTHIVLSLWANDINAGRTMKDIITNVRQMAEYAIGHGCAPIITMGYGTQSGSQMANYVLMYDDLTEGFDNVFIANYAERHSA